MRLHEGDDVGLLVIHVLNERSGESIHRGGQLHTGGSSRRSTPDRQFRVDLRMKRIDLPMLFGHALYVRRQLRGCSLLQEWPHVDVLARMMVMQDRPDEPQMPGHRLGACGVAVGNATHHTAGETELSAKHPVHHGHFATIQAFAVVVHCSA